MMVMKKSMIAAVWLAVVFFAKAEPYPAAVSIWTVADRTNQIAAGKTQYDALYAAYRSGAASYTIPPGDYRWGIGGKSAYLLNDMTNFTVSAYGATFWVDTDTNGTVRGGFSFNNCSNVVLAGVTVDCDPLPFTQGRIVAWNATNKTVDMALDTGYPTLLDQGVTNTGRIGYFSENGELWLNNRADSDTDLKLLTNGNLRLTFSIGRIFAADENLHVGKRLALIRESGVNLFDTDSLCRRITFKDCTCYTGSGMVFSGSGKDIVIDGAHCIRRPGTDRLLGFVTTGHYTDLRTGLRVINSEFSYSMDDFMNMDSTANLVFRKETATRFLIFSRNLAPLNQAAPFDPGDTMLFYTYSTFYKTDEAHVVSVEQITDTNLVAEARNFPNVVAAAYTNATRSFLNGGLWRVVFDRSLSAKPTNWCYSLSYAGEDALFENCHFFNSGQTSSTIIPNSRTTVRGCRFENIRSVAILAGFNQASMQGPVLDGLLIESNTFVNCGYHLRNLEPGVEALGTVSIVNAFASEASGATEAKNIVIRNNTFIDSAVSSIQINNASNCLIMGNTILGAGATALLGAGAVYGSSNAAYGVFLHVVKNCTVTNNLISGFTANTKGFIGYSTITDPAAGNNLQIDGFGPLTASPAVIVRSPSFGTVVPRGQAVQILVDAGDANGSVALAELVLDGVVAGESRVAPYVLQLNTAALRPGLHSFKVRVTDNDGNVGLSTLGTLNITASGSGFLFIISGSP